MKPKLVGAHRTRREDPELVTGRAKYTDDFQVPGMAHAAVLRSQYGHARVLGLDTDEAAALDGVVGVYTASDIADSDAPGVLHEVCYVEGAVETDLPFLAREVVRYVGQPVALVVAEDRYTANDALDRIDVEYERLDAVVDPKVALAADAPVVHDRAPDNVAYDWSFGEADATEAAFADADHTVGIELRNQRLIGDPMEPRAILAEYDGDRLQVTTTTQSPYGDRPTYAETLGIAEEDIRVIAPSVGGAFGIKGGPYPDEAAVAWASVQLARPVKWAATRTEGHRSDNQSRDWYFEGELAVDDDGTMQAIRVTAHNTVGAYNVFGPTLSGNVKSLLSGQYEIPAAYGRMVGSFTNTAPIAAYRGAGRPEVIYFLERLVDEVADELGIDPVELRRRNQIPSDAFPYESATGAVYDSGDYAAGLDLALETVDYEALRERQAALREEDRYLGIGLSCFVENTGTGPGLGETASVRLEADGGVLAALGTHDHGQGHRTTFSQLLADELGVDYDAIEVREGDTDDLPSGTGTYGSRSAALGGSAVVEAAKQVKEQARAVAADRLEATVEDLEFDDGAFHVTGAPDRSVDLAEVAAIAAEDGVDLEATTEYEPPNYGFAFGTHIAAVEVDPESGEIAFERYVAVDDCGTVINPMIVEGQIHGGVAQGIGQALLEKAEYDETGTLLTASLQDYALPRAHHLPEMETEETVTPSPHNPLGVKGSGESGTIAATPAVANAVVDALRPLGVDDVELPITPETVWRAVNDAG